MIEIKFGRGIDLYLNIKIFVRNNMPQTSVAFLIGEFKKFGTAIFSE